MRQIAMRILGFVLIVFGTVMLIKNIHAAQSMPTSTTSVNSVHD